jgi:NAD(P)-dependent dehydrogenase (short-subunit alcohol dehydrogenase family)
MALLQGVKAIVTGGASGIGEATARRMAAEGAAVAIIDRDAEGAKRVADETGGVAVVADVGAINELGGVIDDTVVRLGGLTTLVNNAGVGNLKPLHTYTDSDWNRLIRVNFDATFAGTRAAVRHMRRAGGGSIVNMASVSGVIPTRGEAPYAAAKAGVIALTRSTALEYGPFGIRANCVSPGFIRTALTDFAFTNPAWIDPLEAATPLRRVGEPDDVAKVIVFLCSDLASYVTGQNLLVDGGSILPSAQVDHLLTELLGTEAIDPG